MGQRGECKYKGCFGCKHPSKTACEILTFDCPAYHRAQRRVNKGEDINSKPRTAIKPKSASSILVIDRHNIIEVVPKDAPKDPMYFKVDEIPEPDDDRVVYIALRNGDSFIARIRKTSEGFAYFEGGVYGKCCVDIANITKLVEMKRKQ